MKDYWKMSEAFTESARNGNDLVCGDIFVAKFVDKVECEYAAHAINSHDELVEMNKELLSELKAMAKAYVNLMESGKDRIESLGGDCDEVAYMAAHDANLVHACSVIGKYDGGAA